MTVGEALQLGGKRLAAAGIAQPAREASSLACFALTRGRAFLIAHPEYQFTEAEAAAFFAILERREAREPLQYITGRQEFYGLDFKVTPDVLIPRPETELIVDAAVERLSQVATKSICEVGVGSGCILISVLAQAPHAFGVGLDISARALELATENAALHEVGDRIEFRVSDVFADLSNEKFAIIVSNPPYISAADMVNIQPEVGLYEPRSALTDGADGLSIIRRIIAGAPGHLTPGGWLILEIGIGQRVAVAEMFQTDVWSNVIFVNDLQGIPRTVVARRVTRVTDDLVTL